MTRLTDG